MFWFLEQKDRSTPLHPDMSEKVIRKRILRKCGVDLEHATRRRCIEPCSTEDYINAMEDITTRTKNGRKWYKPPIDNKTSEKPISKPNKPVRLVYETLDNNNNIKSTVTVLSRKIEYNKIL
ncbi:hypothetical protein O181_108329 [Austropuccinia psidii MF-1]|uniref:Uncharacterized protein n=1 Tax=Austropuccinia psidii MF-1 TaxID=1389203 RepID=A0A9Q3JVU8_9BASI|nr:hypothetical protein [Austropuccinia psidii MF-1]